MSKILATRKRNPSNSVEIDLINSKLYDLDFIQELPPVLTQVEEIYLNKNFFANIDGLNQLFKLTKISASDNYIVVANLVLTKLVELDLRNNFLEKVPTLKDLPSLKILNLNNNKIVSVKLVISE